MLQTASGTVLSSSQYRLDSPYGRSKWANTRDKLTPVVTALLATHEDQAPGLPRKASIHGRTP